MPQLIPSSVPSKGPPLGPLTAGSSPANPPWLSPRCSYLNPRSFFPLSQESYVQAASDASRGERPSPNIPVLSKSLFVN